MPTAQTGRNRTGPHGRLTGMPFFRSMSLNLSLDLPWGLPWGSLWGSLWGLFTVTLLLLAGQAHASEHVVLRNGYDLTCDHQAVDGAKTRLYLNSASTDYIDVNTVEITTDELLPDSAATAQTPSITGPTATPSTSEVLSSSELHEVLKGAGGAHDLDVDLLASVVHAESNSHVHAQSRAGAQGLMQLMPGTAATLGVHNVFAPSENVGGGAAYLDALLSRYHNNLAFALAAYNAGPGAVDRWHGIPPYRETRAYVARIIHEFNQRYAARQTAALAMHTSASAIKP